MQGIKGAAAAVLCVALSGCMSTPVERAGAGALAGYAVADVTGGNGLTGAVLGAALGAVSCGAPGLPRCRGY